MMPNIVKGSNLRGLLVYLAGPGDKDRSPHRDQRVVAGDFLTFQRYGGPIDTRRAAEVARLLDTPRMTVLRGAAVTATNYAKARGLMEPEQGVGPGMSRREALAEATRDVNAWHCSLALSAHEPDLSDETWKAIAEDFMREMGFISQPGVPDVRWVAINHGRAGKDNSGGDHIHIAMSMVRPDGSIADTYRDWPRSQAAANMLEHKYGLEVLASREEGGTEIATRPDERERAKRLGAPETDREALQRRVRALAGAAGSEAEFVRELRAVGVSVKPRFAKGGEQVSGYSVRMPVRSRPGSEQDADGGVEKAIWFPGKQLAKDLTLPALRGWAGWDTSEAAQAEALAEWQKTLPGSRRTRLAADPEAISEAAEDLAVWQRYLRTIPVDDLDGWAKAASATAGVFAAHSLRVEAGNTGPYGLLARQLARAGQMPAHRRLTRQRAVQPGLSRATRLLLWQGPQNVEASSLALVVALADCVMEIKRALEATERARAAVALTEVTRASLTAIHLRSAGLDPRVEHDLDIGRPAWAAAYRTAAILSGNDLDAAESHIAAQVDARRERDAALGIRPVAQPKRAPRVPQPGAKPAARGSEEWFAQVEARLRGQGGDEASVAGQMEAIRIQVMLEAQSEGVAPSGPAIVDPGMAFDGSVDEQDRDQGFER